MTRKQQIEGEARRRNPYVGGTKGDISSALMEEFIAGAEWADKTMIDKACDLYRKELQQMQKLLAMIRTDAADVLNIEGSVADFRKAMEG